MAFIESTKDGRPLYRVRWNYARTPDGKRTYDERRFRDRDEALAFHDRVTTATTGDTERLTVAALCDAWIRWKSNPPRGGKPWARRTLLDNQQQVRLRIVPFLGRDRVAELDQQRIEEWIDWMLDPKRGTSNVVANKALSALKQAVKWGRARQLTENVAVAAVEALDEPPPKEAHPYTPSEVSRIMAGCTLLRDATMIAVAAYGGLRWSELRGLQWGDIDWTGRFVRLERSIDIDRSVKSTKSDKPRTIPILDPGMDALEAWRDAQPSPPTSSAWVFPNDVGRVLTSAWHSRNLRDIREACGIHFDPHELRDTYASILIAAGVGELELTMWLGHSTVEVTMRRYGRLYAARKTTMASKANAILSSLG